MALAPTDSVDQTVARSLGVLLKINDAPVSHTLERGFFFPPPFKGILEKTVFQNGAGILGRLKSLSLSI